MVDRCLFFLPCPYTLTIPHRYLLFLEFTNCPPLRRLTARFDLSEGSVSLVRIC